MHVLERFRQLHGNLTSSCTNVHSYIKLASFFCVEIVYDVIGSFGVHRTE